MTFARGPVFLMAVRVLGSAAPVSADPALGLSIDGATWTSDLTVPLFDPDTRWVPGDTRDATFQVRNQSGDTAVLSVDILGTAIHTLLDTGDLTVSARGGGGVWRDVSTPGTHRLVSDVKERSGASSPVDVIVAFSPAATNQSMLLALDLRFHIRLTQSVAAAPASGDLPGTGGQPTWVLLLGVAMAAIGLTMTSRDQEKDVTHV